MAIQYAFNPFTGRFDAVIPPDLARLVNTELVPMPPGSPVVSWLAGCAFARSSATSRSPVLGLVQRAADPTLEATIIGAGPLRLTTAEWDAITGQVGGLSTNAAYWLDATAGKLTTVAPTADGLSVVLVGHAISPAEMLISIAAPILL